MGCLTFMHLSSDVFVELTGRRSNEFEGDLSRILKAN
jgi:hypothetical protein